MVKFENSNDNRNDLQATRARNARYALLESEGKPAYDSMLNAQRFLSSMKTRQQSINR